MPRILTTLAVLAVASLLWAQPEPGPHAFVVSPDSRYVTFVSDATDLVSGPPPARDEYGFALYLFDRATSRTSAFQPVRLCTLLDTRRRKQGPALRSNTARSVMVHGLNRCGIPGTAKAASVRATVFDPTGKGNVRFFRGDLKPPTPHSGILRFAARQSVSGDFLVPIAEDCTVSLLPFVAGKGSVQVLFQVDGYFE